MVDARSKEFKLGKYYDEEFIVNVKEIAKEVALEIYEEKKEDIIKHQWDSNIQQIKEILKKYRLMQNYICEMEEHQPIQLSRFECIGGMEDKQIIHILEHFDKTLIAFKNICKESGKEEDIRCFHIISDLYIKKENEIDTYLQGEDRFSQLAEKYHINKRTVYKDINKAINILATLYYGILI